MLFGIDAPKIARFYQERIIKGKQIFLRPGSERKQADIWKESMS